MPEPAFLLWTPDNLEEEPPVTTSMPEANRPQPQRQTIRLDSVLSSDDEIENLREQFYVTLRAQLVRIEDHAPPESGALQRVRELLAPGRRPRWSECYEVEQLMVSLLDEASLRLELELRLVEAHDNLKRAGLLAYYDREVNHPNIDAAGRRVLLARLLDDLQWRYTVQEGKRRFSKSLTTRTSMAFLVALAAFWLLAAFAYLERWVFNTGDIRLLYACGVVGAWGATFSMLTGLQGTIEKSAIYDLNVMRSMTMVTARALVGAGAACILYLFFHSGFIAGSAFPNLTGSEMCSDGTTHCLKMSMVALLMVWCFVAGFSEKLVPGLLARAERKADGDFAVAPGSPGPSDRYRPIELKTAPKVVGPPSPVPTAPSQAAERKSADPA
jgi:hypothetical protein